MAGSVLGSSCPHQPAQVLGESEPGGCVCPGGQGWGGDPKPLPGFTGPQGPSGSRVEEMMEQEEMGESKS